MIIPTKTRVRPEARTAAGNRANKLVADFLQIDSEIALTLSGIALAASDPEKSERTTQTARRAYDTIARLRTNVELSHAEGDKLDANLQRLKKQLQTLGQSF